MKTQWLILFAGALFLSSANSYGWIFHHIMTRGSLKCMTVPDRTVTVRTLESFLEKNKDRIAEALSSPEPVSDPARFKRALKINPKTAFPFFIRCVPGGCENQGLPRVKDRNTLPEKQYYLNDPDVKETFLSLKPGNSVKVEDILSTYSNEPDWGMDQGLFRIREYGFPPHPIAGDGVGLSSQVPFHMIFLTEDFIARTLFPEHLISYLPARVRTFEKLSRLAFEAGEKFWGYRFLGWVLHYLGDITQPFHTKMVPHGGWMLYLKYMLSGDKKTFSEDVTTLVQNRHLLFEMLAGYLLYKSAMESGIKPGTCQGGGGTNRMTDLDTWITKFASTSGKRASEADELVVAYFDSRYSDNTGFDVEADENFLISKQVRSDKVHQKMMTFLQDVMEDSHEAVTGFLGYFFKQ